MMGGRSVGELGEHLLPRSRGSSASLWTGALSRVPVRLLALFGLILGGCGMISLYERFLSTQFAPASDNLVIVSIGGVTGTDLVATRANPAQPQTPSPFRFTEIAQQAGIDFVHFSGMTNDRHFPTANGSGVAIFDYDNDGKLDLYFATGTLLPVGTARKGPNRLFRNRGGNRFDDVTEASGLGFAGYCHGIVVGDIDNDGDQDVFLCNYGPNLLFRNNGNGTFKDITNDAGVGSFNWSTGGAFLDYDNDGDLDLYVTNYGRWKLPDDDQFCTWNRAQDRPSEAKVRTYCSPKTITPARHFLYRNNGDGTFTDVSVAAGVGRTDGRGFGVVAADLNGDGRIDLYVANDMCPNFVFLNRGDGTFDDVTDVSGAGYDSHGLTHAGMGVDAEDVDGDGLPDLLVTNFSSERNSLYRNVGAGVFEDQTATSGMASDSKPWVGWGCALADFDNDGWPDCFVSNGHVDDNLELLGQKSPYAHPPLLHRNLAGRRFRLATRDAGPYFDSDHVGRGAAFGDFDNDGDLDIVVNHKDGAPALLRNDTKTANHWIRLSLVGTKSNRDAVGALVTVELQSRTLVRQRKGGASLESAHDPRLLIGLGQETLARKVSIRWPSGRLTTVEQLAADKGYRVVEPHDKTREDTRDAFEDQR
jgi:enediyne biosynthesis protein E4